MAARSEPSLSRRERQIMDIIYAAGSASVADVLGAMPDPPSYSAVRALMRILVDKGHLKHRTEGNKYIYLPTRGRREASRSAMRRLLQTFFAGSTEEALVALLEVSPGRPGRDELDRLAQLIEDARKEGR